MNPSFCQSCGIPLFEKEEFEKKEGWLKIQVYFYYCCKNGEFVSDVTMDE